MKKQDLDGNKKCVKNSGELLKGCKDLAKGINTLKFLTLEEIKQIPKSKIVTCARITVDYRPQNKDPHRVRVIVGGI